jgi:hypothetical protein
MQVCAVLHLDQGGTDPDPSNVQITLGRQQSCHTPPQ